ncbi:MAG: nickel-dependent lactate racemase [Oscillospiraceae bacterium]|nr:nickel-dependent lactate racemase [Oscillospiraceae bacterium]
MLNIPIPYHTTNLVLNIRESNLKAIIEAHEQTTELQPDEVKIVKESLANPIGSVRLRDLAKDKEKVLLITSDHTRSVPSRITLPILLNEIREFNRNIDITIIVATGLHRKTTEDEMRSMFGDDIVNHEHVVVSDAYNEDDFIYICDLPSGASFSVHKEATECDLLIAEGFIEPHFFAGYSGGRKSVLPGISSKETINENHSFRAIESRYAVAGVMKDNPISEDMDYAAKRVNLQFILNVALNSKKQISRAFCGDLFEAHAAGVKYIDSVSRHQAVYGDIVVTGNGGYPLDQNLYQSVKAVSTAQMCAKDDAVIVMCCSCVDGMGGEHFERIMTSGTPEAMNEYLSKIPDKKTIPEQWNAQVYFKTLMKHKVILVSDFFAREAIEKANMIAATTIDEAMDIAFAMKGEQAEVVVIPDGVAVMIV